MGRVVADFDQGDLDLAPDQGARDYALRVTHILRGEAHAGDLLDVQYLLPNWPQIRFRDGTHSRMIASCTHLPAAPTEVIALVFDALHPGGPMRSGDLRWIEPPTRYNAVGVIERKSSRWERERVTLRQLGALAALPQTDIDPQPTMSSQTSNSASLIWVAGLLAVWFGLRRFARSRRA